MSEDSEPSLYHGAVRKERFNFDHNIAEDEIHLLKNAEDFVSTAISQFPGADPPYLWRKEDGSDTFDLWTWGRTARPFYQITRKMVESIT